MCNGLPTPVKRCPGSWPSSPAWVIGCEWRGAARENGRLPNRAQIVHRTRRYELTSAGTIRTARHERPAQNARAGRRRTRQTARAQLGVLSPRSYPSGARAMSNERSPLEDAPLQTIHEVLILVWIEVAVPVEHNRHRRVACHGRHLLWVGTVGDPEGYGGVP